LLTRAPEYGLSRFEKRLVYQIVRVEYPYLSATARGGAVEVTRFNKSRNDAIKKQRQAVFHECVQKQIGLGWFVEALIGGKIEDLDIAQLITRSTSQPILVDVEKSKNDFMDLCNQIRQTQIVLVGHNLFVDLVFLYRTFIGHLPQHVEEFCDAIHELFPRIIDTKFMATNANYRRSNSSLEDVDREYAQQSLPSIGTLLVHICCSIPLTIKA
jgi:poly(A)-specific ribonuclease